MAFHRFVTPTYFGGLPVGYDLINVVSGGTGAGGSAFADGAKGGGNPNTGTYFVAWGEDATSSNANRGMKALSQNTDLLDDLLHRDLALAVKTTDATAGSPVPTVILPTNTFLGTSGYTTSTADLARLFTILDTNDDELIIQSTGQKVQVTSVTLGTGDVIGGGGANGSFSGNTVQLNISPSIPTGVSYRIWYATRTNLAVLPADALTTIKIRNAEEVPAEVENLFRLLHGNNLAWNAGWTSTIWDLALSGLNERYSRATAASTSAPEAYWATGINTIGAGGWINRQGPGLTVYSGDAGELTDPLNALFVGKNVDTDYTASGGVVSFAAFGSRRSSSANANEVLGGLTPGAAAFMAIWPHGFGSGLSTNYFTRVVSGSSATLSNVGGYNIDTGEAIVLLTGASNYFQTGGLSAVAVGYDLIEISYIQGGQPIIHSFVIVGLGASNDVGSAVKARVRHMNGAVPDFSATSGATVRWISNSFTVGDGAGRWHRYLHAYADTQSVMFDGLFYQVPPSLSSTGSDNDVLRTPASFSAQSGGPSVKALQWGGFNYSVPSGPVFPSYLQGDGGINVTGSDVNVNGSTNTAGAVKANYVVINGVSPTGILAGGGAGYLFDTSTGSAGGFKLSGGTYSTIGILLQNVRTRGIYYLLIDHTLLTSTATLDWTNGGGSLVTSRFGPGDDQLAPGAGRTMWTGIAISTTEIWWTVTRY